MRKLFKKIGFFLLVGIPVTIAVSVISQFFIEWTKAKGFYDNPTEKVDGVINQSKGIWITLAEIFASNNFRIAIGVAAAFSLGMGICYFAIKYDDKKKLKSEERRFEDEGYVPLPQKPSEGRVFANILNRRDNFTLKESALLLVDRKLSGEMSDTANAQLQELRIMMRDGKIQRHGEITPIENLNRISNILNSAANGTTPTPFAFAKITRKQLYDLSIELKIPIAGLKP